MIRRFLWILLPIPGLRTKKLSLSGNARLETRRLNSRNDNITESRGRERWRGVRYVGQLSTFWGFRASDLLASRPPRCFLTVSFGLATRRLNHNRRSRTTIKTALLDVITNRNWDNKQSALDVCGNSIEGLESCVNAASASARCARRDGRTVKPRCLRWIKSARPVPLLGVKHGSGPRASRGNRL
ncbi:hypothetical protein J6590_056394 [Homalodisca vitripennis]|nr:hypothetical protein J6590_056394 [Homalodisca vitripennis]